MAVTMSTRREIVEKQMKAYKRASKKEKSHILTSLVTATGLTRDHLSRVLSGRYKYVKQKVIGRRRGRKPAFRMEHKAILVMVWELLGFPSSRRLKAAMPDVLESLERHGRKVLDPDTKTLMLKMSHGTMDRLLRADRKRLKPFGLSTTKPGSLLKGQIPVRRGTDWDDAVPGFLEIDLVAHCGSSTRGQYVNTLNTTDICSGWTECRAVINKARTHTLTAMKDIQSELPFPLKGIDSDNGSEFINDHFLYFCVEEDLCFTRSRPNRSNDSCYVEQKNWSVVRKAIGYSRFEGNEAVELLNQYYRLLCTVNNYFLPSQKLIDKQRDGGKVKKKHDHALSPYRRLLGDPNVTAKVKSKLKQTYETLDLVQLNLHMNELLSRIQALSLGY